MVTYEDLELESTHSQSVDGSKEADGRFLVHSNLQSVSSSPLTLLHVIRSPRPFLAILEYYKQSKSEARGGLGTRLCILFAVYTSNPACCHDYAVCNFLRLLQSFQSLITSTCSWSIWMLYCLRQPNRSRLGPKKTQCWLKCKDLCSIFSRAKGRSAAELEEARVECAGWLCTLG